MRHQRRDGQLDQAPKLVDAHFGRAGGDEHGVDSIAIQQSLPIVVDADAGELPGELCGTALYVGGLHDLVLANCARCRSHGQGNVVST